MSEQSLLSPARVPNSDGANMPELLAELALDESGQPMRASDAKVWTCVHLMARQEWVRGTTSVKLAAEWGCAVNLVEHYAATAAQFLRLIKEPDMVKTWAAARLTEIGNENKPDRVPAILGAAKVAGVLDQKGDAAKPPELSVAERNERLRMTLRDPPPELVTIVHSVSDERPEGFERMMEGAGWRRE